MPSNLNIPPPPPPPRRPPAPPRQGVESDVATSPTLVVIHPWLDPVVDRHGHDPRSPYVERFWLATLGPSAMWLLRRLADGFEAFPDGYRLDLAVTARALGLSPTGGQHNAFARAFDRCVMFGLARHRADGFDVRRKVPDAAHRHLTRLPAEIQQAHERWRSGAAAPPAGVGAA